MHRKLIALGISVSMCAVARGGGCEPSWLYGTGQDGPGVSFGTVHALGSWDPDGGGPDAPVLVVGGTFSTAGNQISGPLALWDGEQWSVLPPGFECDTTPPEIHAVAEFNGDLFVGGTFTDDGSTSQNLAYWDGSSWNYLGISDPVYDLQVFGGELYIATPSAVLKFDGMSVSTVGGPFARSIGAAFVYTLEVYGGSLYAAGDFTTAGATTVNNIARLSGGSWVALGSGTVGTDREIFDMTVYGGSLVVGGSAITTAGSTSVNGVAQWNGSAWSSMGSISVLIEGGAFCIADGTLYVGGYNTLQAYNGSTWNTVGGLLANAVHALQEFQGQLVIGGDLESADGMDVNHVASYDGSDWRALGFGLAGQPDVWASYQGNLVAAGTLSVAGGGPIANIASWDGAAWTPVGSGLTNGVNTPFVRALAVNGNSLYAGGTFTAAGGSSASNIAVWNGSSWAALGSGTNAGTIVNALVFHSGTLYAGGSFSTAGGSSASNIAAWNGSSWSALGSGLTGGSVLALAVYGGDIIVAGSFTTAGGTSVGHIARWNGSSWSALGSGLDGQVNALAVNGSDLYVGGQFANAGGSSANNIARWNGSTWSAIGSGLNGAAHHLAFYNDDLIVSGYFTSAGGTTVNNLARYDGTWSAFSNVDGSTYTLPSCVTLDVDLSLGAVIAHGNELIIAGLIGSDDANDGERINQHWARWTDGLPSINDQPEAVTAVEGSNVSFSVIASAPTADPASYQWRKAGTNVSNGTTSSGSVISGATTATLQIAGIECTDAGSYDCVVTNACGSATSNTATLTFVEGCPGDANGDNQVNGADLSVINGQWQTNVSPGTGADFNCDGIVNGLDLGIWQTNFGTSC